MNFNFTDKKIFITGSSGGIGKKNEKLLIDLQNKLDGLFLIPDAV